MSNLTEYAEAGFKETEKNPHIYSSPAFIAYQLGRYMRATNRTMPRKVSMSRGYSIRADKQVYKWIEYGGGIVNEFAV